MIIRPAEVLAANELRRKEPSGRPSSASSMARRFSSFQWDQASRPLWTVAFLR